LRTFFGVVAGKVGWIAYCAIPVRGAVGSGANGSGGRCRKQEAEKYNWCKGFHFQNNERSNLFRKAFDKCVDVCLVMTFV